MKPEDKHIEAEPKTAGEYRQTADAHVQELKGFWKRFVVSGLFVIAVVVIILACLAWFAANNRVNATTASLNAKAVRYTITAQGNKAGTYDSEVSDKLDTSDSMQVSATSNLNNYDGSQQLGPGSYGSLTFTVTPCTDDVGSITVNLSRYLATKTDEVQSSANAETDEESDQLLKLISGHIVFFKANSNGFYEQPILNGGVTIDKSEFGGASRTPVARTVYWIWPEHFRDFVLTGGVNYEKNLFAATDAAGYNALLNDINGNDSWKKYFLERPATGSDSTLTPIQVKQGMSTADLQTCSDAYDAADEEIGNSVRYVQIRLTANEADA